MSKLKIVLADDHPIVRMGVCDMLERDPRFEVVGEASNPSELVSLYRQADPHIAITDYSMPGDERYGDGLKLIDYLLRNFPRTRVLIFTMVSNRLILDSLYDHGVAGVVLKSGELDELLLALDVVLQNRIYRGAHMIDPANVLTSRDEVENRFARLSMKEFEVLRHFVSGNNVCDIARLLKRSVKTVSTQKISAMRKLEVNSDQALMTFCVRANLFH
ncbi:MULTISPECIES: response regulator [Pseudomonas aeruginosa group]|uniref:Capsular synthesis regulator component B n=2 Tax=Pseudomonas paraeruginosa TaxID=2994495 RepID=A0A2R3J100_9PSED|nr:MULTISPECIES: response regulator [Pseudomonas aeruginosa group]VTS15131.1 response regulator protein [Streptococcus dysgalactiae subsp. equisimilis]ABR82701.2 DNA-binding response regulator, LuxR family [Pseudomonas aeruginosa PA7]AVK07852.1 capsular synthesis regulator component B [Pseudomonas paraeruginosa]AVR67969.1 DNA-binding response regulator [Pseudomonas paraeruginosa]AWE89371.1 capsular synthesis regulator component B [Pseudomonas paraeruginosa]